jgi:protoporphyrinogen oxidase
VVCVLARLKRPLTPYFWLNISDPTMRIPGLIEYTNLNPLPEHVVYIPYYLPGDHPDYQQADSWFIARSRDYLQRIAPDLQPEEILSIRAGRYRYAQPICPPDFLQRLPPLQPGVANLWVADTSHYYPEDRSISESIALGLRLAGQVAGD